MLFVADAIPSELQRIVEFLNTQMDPAEVLAVEIRHYSGEGQKILVPRVYGQKAEKGPAQRRREPWDEASFIERFSESCPEDVELAQRIIAWAKKRGLECAGGRGLESANLAFGNSWIKPLWLCSGYPKNPFVQFAFSDSRSSILVKVAEGPELLTRLCEMLNRIDGVKLSPDHKWPSIRLSLLKEPSAWEAYTEAMSTLFDSLGETPNVR